MEWMYKAKNNVNTEDYLLGKKVDGAVLEAAQNNFASPSEDASSIATVDIVNKIREDPLFTIKQKEANRRKALLDNPIRLKQLQKMLQSQVGKESKKKKVKKKKKEKKSKHKSKKSRQESSESEEDSDSDDDLDAKLMEKLRGQGMKGKEEALKNVLKKEGGYGLVAKDHKYSPPAPKRKHDVKQWRRSPSPEENHYHRRKDEDRRKDRKRERSPDRMRDAQKHSSHSSRGRSRSRSPRRYEKNERRSPRQQERKEDRSSSNRKMDADEMERKRQEMIDNAKWRDEQRSSRVKKYKAVDAHEEEMEKRKSTKAEFFNPLKLSSNSSVEDRIKRNIYNIQRTNAALDKNFAKR